jgi:hypothetical protein
MESLPPVPPENPPGPPSAPPGPPAPPAPESLPASVAPLPWEQPGAPPFAAFFTTLHRLLFRPREAFARMAVTGGYGRPIAFALILGLLGIWVTASYEWVLGDPLNEMWSRFGDSGGPDIPRAAVFLLTVFGAPFLTAFTVLLSAILCHLLLMIFGGAGGGFGATFRVICYSMAGYVWTFVPFVGGLVSAVWMVVLAIIGLSVVHRIGTGKAAAAVLLPDLLCCLCCAPLFIWRVLSRM